MSAKGSIVGAQPSGHVSAEMQELLQQLVLEDSELPDPTTLAATEGRKLAEESNIRWNQNLPPMQQTDELTFTGPDGNAIPATLFTPAKLNPGLILFIHGGGFAFCSVKSHERCARLLASEAQCSVLSIEYRLAPEHPFPAGLQDCISVFRQLDTVRKTHPQTKGIVAVAGDSAGANLALALILNEQTEQQKAPDFAMLFYGVFGADFNTPSYREFENGPGLTRAKMMRYMDWYTDASQRNNPLSTPLAASDEMLQRLPPIYINAAEIDPLCSDTELLAARLLSLGRQDQLHVFSGVVHGFMQMTLRLPSACRATSYAATAFRQFAGYQQTPKTTRSPS